MNGESRKKRTIWNLLKGCPLIYEMFVSGSLRGQGIGTRLLKEIEVLAKRSGYDSIGLNAHPLDEMPQEKLVAWYEKRGFSQQDGSKELMMKTL